VVADKILVACHKLSGGLLARETLFFMAEDQQGADGPDRESAQTDWLRRLTCGVITERTAIAEGV
jgi:hypothetical protein